LEKAKTKLHQYLHNLHQTMVCEHVEIAKNNLNAISAQHWVTKTDLGFVKRAHVRSPVLPRRHCKSNSKPFVKRIGTLLAAARPATYEPLSPRGHVGLALSGRNQQRLVDATRLARQALHSEKQCAKHT
jgi:hypothetical protein